MVAPARRAALRVLRAVHGGAGDLAAALDRERTPLVDSRDRALVSELTLGVCRWRAALDHVIALAGRRDARAFDALVLDVLRLGAYQLLYLTRVPAAAAVDEAVNLSREAGSPRAAGAVNAILRTIARQRHTFAFPGPENALAYLSVTLSHPEWLAARWIARHGLETAAAWARFNNEPAPICLRAHRWRETRDELAAWLHAQGVETEPTVFAPDGLVVTQGNVFALEGGPGWRFTVQEESSQLVAAFVAAQPGERVLDTCAAPGGKTTALAGACGPAGLVVAADSRPRRVRLLGRTLDAGEVPGVHVVRADATAAPPYRPVFDAVLIDAPCSGLATIRRDPDVRWRRHEADLAPLAAVQLRMLLAATAAVSPTGRLVYATCSSEPEENQHVVEQFLAAMPDWRVVPPPAGALPKAAAGCLDARGCLAPQPDRHALEPFFACSLRRTR